MPINAIPTISIVILAGKGSILNIIKTAAIIASIIPKTHKIILSFLFIIKRIKLNLKLSIFAEKISRVAGKRWKVGLR